MVPISNAIGYPAVSGCQDAAAVVAMAFAEVIAVAVAFGSAATRWT